MVVFPSEKAETVRVILLPAGSPGRKHNHADSLGRKPLITHNSLCPKQRFAATYDGQPRQEVNIGGLAFVVTCNANLSRVGKFILQGIGIRVRLFVHVTVTVQKCYGVTSSTTRTKKRDGWVTCDFTSLTTVFQ